MEPNDEQLIYVVISDRDKKILAMFDELKQADDFLKANLFATAFGRMQIRKYMIGKPTGEPNHWSISVDLTNGQRSSTEGDAWSMTPNELMTEDGVVTGKFVSKHDLMDTVLRYLSGNMLYSPSAQVESYVSQEHCVKLAQATYEAYQQLKNATKDLMKKP